MICAKCQSKEFDEQGICKACGFQPSGQKLESKNGPATTVRKPPRPLTAAAVLTAQPEAAKAITEVADSVVAEPAISAHNSLPTGMIEMHCPAPGGVEAPELPAWRVELSKRLQEIRQKRKQETVDETAKPAGGSNAAAATDGGILAEPKEAAGVAQSPTPPPKDAARIPSGRLPRVESRPKPRVVKEPLESLPLFQPLQSAVDLSRNEHAAEKRVSARAVHPPSPEITTLIDSVVSGIGSQGESPAKVQTQPLASGPSKLILVSRTLSGLVDWILIVLCTGAFILAADSVASIDFIDPFTLIIFAALLLAIFFVYSLFFLSTSNQTIGMMFTDLRLVGADGKRPRFHQILVRCPAYLISVFLGGIGLIWALFNRECRCLHDSLSSTKVDRVSW